MHPAFHFERMALLPPWAQGYAIRAAAGSLADMDLVVADILREPGYVAGFLPVVFLRLDPALIPDSASLDMTEPHPNVTLRLSIAFSALRSLPLLELGVSPEVLKEVWPRAWNWIIILEQYPFLLKPCISVEDVRHQIMLCLPHVFLEREVMHLMHHKPGVHGFFARTWESIRPGQQMEEMPFVSTAVSTFMYTSEWTSSQLEEFIEGTGMSLTALAALIVRHINSSRRKLHFSERRMLRMLNMACLHGILQLVRSAGNGTLSLQQPLLSAGITKAITKATLAIAQALASLDTNDIHPPERVDRLLGACLSALNWAIMIPPGYAYLPEAIQAGLLPAIIALSQLTKCQRVACILQKLLGVILPGALVYRRVVSAFASVNTPTICPSADAPFFNSMLYPHWLAFVALLKQRIELLEYFKSSAYTPTSQCTNAECCLVRPTVDLKCCSGCRLQYYCSVTCQLSAWRSGHRAVCGTLPTDHQRARSGGLDHRLTPIGYFL
ncbi:hypothetical protein C8R43DRAFT_1241416, partial [Mycena crocata]